MGNTLVSSRVGTYVKAAPSRYLNIHVYMHSASCLLLHRHGVQSRVRCHTLSSTSFALRSSPLGLSPAPPPLHSPLSAPSGKAPYRTRRRDPRLLVETERGTEGQRRHFLKEKEKSFSTRLATYLAACRRPLPPIVAHHLSLPGRLLALHMRKSSFSRFRTENQGQREGGASLQKEVHLHSYPHFDPARAAAPTSCGDAECGICRDIHWHHLHKRKQQPPPCHTPTSSPCPCLPCHQSPFYPHDTHQCPDVCNHHLIYWSTTTLTVVSRARVIPTNPTYRWLYICRAPPPPPRRVTSLFVAARFYSIQQYEVDDTFSAAALVTGSGHG